MRKIVPLLLCLVLLFSGCTKQEKPAAQTAVTEEKEIVTLRVMTMGTEPTYAVDEFYEQLDALTIRDLGCIVRFSYVPWGDEKTTINNAIAAGECDIYCNGVFTDYRTLVSCNAFVDLNDYLDLMLALTARFAEISPEALAQCEINGGLYGIPQIGNITTLRDGIFLYRDDLLDEWGLEPVTSLDTMEAYLYAAKSDTRYSEYPMIIDNRVWQCLWDMLSGRSYLEITTVEDMRWAVVTMDQPYQVVSRIETEEFRTILQYVRKWYQDGIIDERILGLTDNEGSRAMEMLMADQKPCETNSTAGAVYTHYIPYLQEAHPDWSWNLMYNSQDARVYRKSMADETCMSVSSRSQYPELAIRLIEKAFTDRTYYDLLVYGVEGMQYHLENGTISYEGIAAEQQRVRWTGLVDPEKEYSTDISGNQWLETKNAYEAEVHWGENIVGDSPLIGLKMNMGGWDTTQLENAWQLYMKPLLCGVTENLEADYAAALEAMYAAGLQDYLDEVQRQLTEYEQSLAAE